MHVNVKAFKAFGPAVYIAAHVWCQEGAPS
jgi:hypothetical protein